MIAWGTVNSAIPVCWSTWLSIGVRDEPESGGGLLVGAIQLAIMSGGALWGLPARSGLHYRHFCWRMLALASVWMDCGERQTSSSSGMMGGNAAQTTDEAIEYNPSCQVEEWENLKLAEDNASIVRRFTEQVITHGDMDIAAQFVWEDVVEQVPFPGQGPGLEGLKDVLRHMRTAFPDLDFSIKEQIAGDSKVASRFEWTGTHQGEFLGVPATGKQVCVWGIVIDRLEEGRIKDTRILMDIFGLMMQFGVLPSAAA